MSKHAISPLGDRVLLKPLEEKNKNKTESGIFLPESVKEGKDGKKAKVVAVGPGRAEDGKLIPVSVKVGQTVLYSWGDTVKDGDDEFVMVRESDILAVIK